MFVGDMVIGSGPVDLVALGKEVDRGFSIVTLKISFHKGKSLGFARLGKEIGIPRHILIIGGGTDCCLQKFRLRSWGFDFS